MKQSERNRLENIYNHLYTFVRGVDRLVCAYCGDTRSCLDHVPPLSVVDYVGTDRLREKEIELLLYPCCNMCNSALGSKPLANYEERLVFLYNKTMKQLNSKTIWNDDEIEELVGNLKRMIAARQLEIRRNFISRLKGMERNLADL